MLFDVQNPLFNKNAKWKMQAEWKKTALELLSENLDTLTSMLFLCKVTQTRFTHGYSESNPLQ